MIGKKIIFGCESRGDGDSPYLTRYTLLHTKRGRLYLHVFHRSDADEHHDHPWDFWTLILWRGYNEVTPEDRRRVWPSRLLFRPATWRHRVELTRRGCGLCFGIPFRSRPCPECQGRGFVERPAVTLVWAGPPKRKWGFFTANGWQHWREYFQERGC